MVSFVLIRTRNAPKGPTFRPTPVMRRGGPVTLGMKRNAIPAVASSTLVRPGLHTELKSEQRFLLRVKVIFGDDALGLEFRQHPKLLFKV